MSLDKGVVIDTTTGQPPIDPKSDDPSAATEDTKRFDKDTELKAKLSKTHKLTDAKSLIMTLYFIQEDTDPMGFSIK
jgi:hypothetical protein